MKRLTIDLRLLISVCTAVLLGSVALASSEPQIGEDGVPILAGEEITDGIGIIDEISFAEGYVLINDFRFEITETTELINQRQKNAAPEIFVTGTRVVWSAKDGRELLSLDHYPFDETDVARQTPSEQQETETAPAAPSSDISLGADGVYRN